MRTSSAITITALLALVVFPPTASGYVHRPVTVSFFPPLSTNGVEAGNVSTSFSLNIIGGYVGRLSGVEFGSMFNIESGDAAGFQASGGVNIVGRSFAGVQVAGGAIIAGGANILGGSGVGCQAAGGVNICGNSFHGVQLAGGFNLNGMDLRGVQIAGGANVNGMSLTGAQIAGGANICGGAVDGFQVAGGFNLAKSFDGAQIGVVNVTGRGKGLQLGVVNIAEDVDIPIGVVSIVTKGRFNVCAWASETSPLTVGLKTGSRIIYNVFALGARPDGDSSLLMLGLGIGGKVPLDPFFIDLDAIGYGVHPLPELFNFEDRGLALLAKLRVTAGWQVTDWLAITAGPALSVWVSDREDGSRIPFYDAPLYRHAGKTSVRIWPGFTAGLQLL